MHLQHLLNLYFLLQCVTALKAKVTLTLVLSVYNYIFFIHITAGENVVSLPLFVDFIFFLDISFPICLFSLSGTGR